MDGQGTSMCRFHRDAGVVAEDVKTTKSLYALGYGVLLVRGRGDVGFDIDCAVFAVLTMQN